MRIGTGPVANAHDSVFIRLLAKKSSRTRDQVVGLAFCFCISACRRGTGIPRSSCGHLWDVLNMGAVCRSLPNTMIHDLQTQRDRCENMYTNASPEHRCSDYLRADDGVWRANC